MTNGTLSWVAIVRLGVIQMALGAIVAFASSTLTRVITIELALPATLPGLLVAIHYAAELLRPRWGHGLDGGNQRTPWIIGGMVVLALSGVAAASSVILMKQWLVLGIVCAFMSFIGIGIGAGATGTSVLVLLSKLVDPSRRFTAAAIIWIMMITGSVLSAVGAGKLLDPFSGEKLIAVSAIISAIAFLSTLLSIWGVEKSYHVVQAEAVQHRKVSFRTALKDVWRERQARYMTLFITISMLAFSAQELIIEPFAGLVFKMTPGETASLFGSHRGGILIGMLVGAGLSRLTQRRSGMPSYLSVSGGCLASALLLVVLIWVGLSNLKPLLQPTIIALGLSNGIFAVSAIGSMMSFVSSGTKSREGVRMGLWGAGQAVASGLGGVFSTGLIDLARLVVTQIEKAYALVFCLEALLFGLAAMMASKLISVDRRDLNSDFSLEQNPVLAAK